MLEWSVQSPYTGGGHALCIIDDENHNNKKSLPQIYICIHCPKVNRFFRDLSRNVAGKNEILHEIFRVVCRFPLHFALYLGNLDYFLDSVHCTVYILGILINILKIGKSTYCTRTSHHMYSVR